ncbi:MAG: DUF6120 family protein [Coprobacillus sp.]
MNKISRQFFKKMNRSFPLLGNEEKRFLDKFKNHLEIYELKYPNQTYDDYIKYFGEPKDIISTYYEHIESEYIVTHMKARKIIKYISVTFLCVFVVTTLTLVFIRYKEYQLSKDTKYYSTEIIEEISDEVDQ